MSEHFSEQDSPGADTKATHTTASTKSTKLVETKTEVTVKVERQVRINRILIMGAAIGALLAMLITTLFPVVPEGYYTMAQIVGFSAVLGAALGLLLSGILALVLVRIAKKQQGTATAIQSSVQ